MDTDGCWSAMETAPVTGGCLSAAQTSHGHGWLLVGDIDKPWSWTVAGSEGDSRGHVLLMTIQVDRNHDNCEAAPEATVFCFVCFGIFGNSYINL